MAAGKKKTFRCLAAATAIETRCTTNWLSRMWSQQAVSKAFKVDDHVDGIPRLDASLESSSRRFGSRSTWSATANRFG